MHLIKLFWEDYILGLGPYIISVDVVHLVMKYFKIFLHFSAVVLAVMESTLNYILQNIIVMGASGFHCSILFAILFFTFDG